MVYVSFRKIRGPNIDPKQLGSYYEDTHHKVRAPFPALKQIC